MRISTRYLFALRVTQSHKVVIDTEFYKTNKLILFFTLLKLNLKVSNKFIGLIFVKCHYLLHTFLFTKFYMNLNISRVRESSFTQPGHEPDNVKVYDAYCSQCSLQVPQRLIQYFFYLFPMHPSCCQHF